MEGSDSRRRLRLRYRASCSICEIELSPGTEAFWDRASRQATCLACDDRPEHAVLAGTAGASALARADQLEERVVSSARRKWGDHAAVVAARIAEDDPSIRAWMKGGDGESRLAAFLGREVGDAVIALHDRVIPGTRNANIDHIFVSAKGV